MLPLLLGAAVIACLAYKSKQTPSLAVAQQEAEAEKTETITTSGVQQAYRPRTSYFLGYSGSVREILRLPENHARGEAVAPLWRLWSGTFGSIKPEQVEGTFNSKTPEIVIPEERHVTPELEEALRQSVERRLWAGGGQITPVGTFG